MLLGGTHIANRDAHGKMTMQFCVRQEEMPRFVDAAHNLLVQSFQLLFVVHVLWMGAETDRAEWCGSHALKVWRVVHPLREKLRQPDMFVDARRQPFVSEIAQDHP